MQTSDFDYDLPPQFIAQTPIEPRDASRLLILNRSDSILTHSIFNQIGQWLKPNDLLVVNQTRVIPARLFARKLPGGGRVELLLLRRIEDCLWEVLVGGKGLKVGRQIEIEAGPPGEVIEVLTGARRLVHFTSPLEPYLKVAGHVPLPPYIHAPLQSPERYQTVYARQSGSAAAPTAGLHFTPQLINTLKHQGVQFAYLTLHVGLDTFAPVTEEDPQQHVIHTEWCELTAEAAQAINATHQAGGRIIAVGTTSVRTLETAARHAVPGCQVGEFTGPTNLFILPGYQFKAVDGMVTNFHLPRSTLLMLVSAFAGRERILAAYETAKQENYRFYSFGDAMLIL
jgi:S-adenosylmethionine:tRNA ribosyltransferase-isomerase